MDDGGEISSEDSPHSSIGRPIDHPQTPKFHSSHSSFQSSTRVIPPSDDQSTTFKIPSSTHVIPPSHDQSTTLKTSKLHSRHSSIARPIIHPQTSKIHSRHSSIAQPINHLQILCSTRVTLPSYSQSNTFKFLSSTRVPLPSYGQSTTFKFPSFKFHSRHSSITRPINHHLHLYRGSMVLFIFILASSRFIQLLSERSTVSGSRALSTNVTEKTSARMGLAPPCTSL